MESRIHPVAIYSLTQKSYFEPLDFLSTPLDLGKLLVLRALGKNLAEDTVYIGKLAVDGKGGPNLFKW